MDEQVFETNVQESYDIMWKMRHDGDLTVDQDNKLMHILNVIDNELGR